MEIEISLEQSDADRISFSLSSQSSDVNWTHGGIPKVTAKIVAIEESRWVYVDVVDGGSTKPNCRVGKSGVSSNTINSDSNIELSRLVEVSSVSLELNQFKVLVAETRAIADASSFFALLKLKIM